MTRSVTLVAGALAALAAALAVSLAPAQPTSGSPLAPPTNGPKHADPGYSAIVGATVHVSPDESYEQATIVIRDGRIVSVQAAATPRGDGKPNPPPAPAGARVFDATGLHVYAGLIDAYVEVDAPKPDAGSPGMHWNTLVTPHRAALDGAGIAESDKESLRALGFVAAAAAPKGGVFRGSGAVVSLAPTPADKSLGEPPVYNTHAFHSLGFETSGWSSGAYPTSHMGVMALLRQTLIDADWERSVAGTKLDTAPSALTPLHAIAAPLLFDADDPLEALLARRIQREHDTGHVLIVGGGSEYQRLDPIAKMDATLVVPLRFPDKPDVSSIGSIDAIDLDRLMAWEQAPTNARRLVAAGADVCITTSKLPKGQKFAANIRNAIKHGLSERDALAALTTNPAKALGVADKLGTIQNGKVASLVVADGPLFDEDTTILDVWTDGQRHVVNEPQGDSLAGEWDLVIDAGIRATLTITDPKSPGKKGKPKVKLTSEDSTGATTEHDAGAVSADHDSLSFTVKLPALAGDSPIIFSGVLSDGALTGAMMRPAGAPAQWRATRVGKAEPETSPFEGDWTLKVGEFFSMEFSVKGDKVNTKQGETKGEGRDVAITGDRISFLVDDAEGAGTYSITGVLVDDEIMGKGSDPQGNTFSWIGARKVDEPETADVPDPVGAPFGAYAMESLPDLPDYVVITGATIWTSSGEGVLDPADYENGTLVVVKDGKIDYVGANKDIRFPADASIVRLDAAGLHMTPGLIDAHSHTGLFRFGVNEAGQAVTTECWIGDSLDPGFINWYRQLAAGVTTANLLHGSANPMGGKSQTVKVRWGAPDAEAMFFEDAPKTNVKFALGENVKQSNWGDNNTTRYPQTRMGVETLMRDRFQAAKEYMDAESKLGLGFRRNLELETLAEVLRGDRLVHCHSYRQDEILMLCRIAEDFGFKIGAFQHGLETYKVADVVKQHAIGASIFSDWWAYKVEVQDAIPYAGPINEEVGLLTSYNSDSDELARRMNIEAAKAVKYSGGRITPEVALRFVTINPAIQLGIEDRVGSIEAGKDADLVLWNAPPLSNRAKPTHVWIDGREYFSLEADKAHRRRIASERERLIAKLLADDMPGDKKNANDADESDEQEPEMVDTPPRASLLARYTRDQLHRAANPRPGDCGCNTIIPTIYFEKLEMNQ